MVVVPVNMSRPSSSAPYSKSPIILSPLPVFPQLPTMADHPELSTSSKSPEGAHEQPSLLDADDDSDSFGSDFGDPPEYLDPGVEQESEVARSISTHGGLRPPQDGSENTIQPSSISPSPDDCVVCHLRRSSKDVPTCGNRICVQQLRKWQGLSSLPCPTSASIYSDSDSSGSDFGDPPEYLNPGVEQESDVARSISTHARGLRPLQDGSENTIQPSSISPSPDDCVVCHRRKSLKDVPTCGNRICVQQLRKWQGLSSLPRPTSANILSSNNRCPVCSNSKPSGNTICGRELCAQRLRFWQGDKQESDVARSISTHGGLRPLQDGSENTIQPSSISPPPEDEDCAVCHRRKSLKDLATCGNRICVQQLREWQGLSSFPRPTSANILSSNNRCPVCSNSKPSGNTICGRELCAQRLRFWQGDDLRSSSTSNGRSGPSSYSSAVQTRSQTRAGGMCEVCHQCPRYSHDGKTLPTCGLSCAAKLNPSGKVEMCDLCRQRPKVVLNGRVYPHCGRTCRDKARSAETTNNGIGTGTCTTCLNCWKAPANIRKDEFCSDSCRETIERRAPLLLEIPRGHSAFNDVEKEFKNAWTNRKAPCPSVKKVYMVCLPAKHDATFEDYGKKVSSTYGIPGGFLLGRKKEEFRWISGLRDCPLGHPGITTPCQQHRCQLCNVLRGTYVPEIFGKGILTTSLPRATQHYDRWAADISLRSKISKFVLLSKVYLGKVAKLDSFQAKSGPPHGASSVSIVNYVHHSRVETNEILVYNCEALRPVYLVSYE